MPSRTATTTTDYACEPTTQAWSGAATTADCPLHPVRERRSMRWRCTARAAAARRVVRRHRAPIRSRRRRLRFLRDHLRRRDGVVRARITRCDMRPPTPAAPPSRCRTRRHPCGGGGGYGRARTHAGRRHGDVAARGARRPRGIVRSRGAARTWQQRAQQREDKRAAAEKKKQPPASKRERAPAAADGGGGGGGSARAKGERKAEGVAARTGKARPRREDAEAVRCRRRRQRTTICSSKLGAHVVAWLGVVFSAMNSDLSPLPPTTHEGTHYARTACR